MAECEKDEEGGRLVGTEMRQLEKSSSISSAGITQSRGKRNPSKGIVIQLTGIEGEWDSPDDNELIFSLENSYSCTAASLCKERQLSTEGNGGLECRSFSVPLSPSLGNCSGTDPSFLSPSPASPGHRPMASLVKSLSTELEPKEGSSLRPKPFLSLVKSISTELSRSEPEVSQSKSDSRLNLHLLKQLAQTKPRSNGDSRTAPPSPSSLSPSGEGPRGGFFRMELEDTKRKLSEAMHEPLSSMFSKIMREEGGGSPKHQSKPQLVPQSSCRSLGRDSSTDTVLSDSPVRATRKTDSEALPVFEWPSAKPHSRVQAVPCPLHQQHHQEEELEICTDGNVMQVFTFKKSDQPNRPHSDQAIPAASPRIPHISPHSRPLPRMSLFCMAMLSYGYFILPLSPYFSGLALGMALGFLVGLLLIRIGSSQASCSTPTRGSAQPPFHRCSLTPVDTEPDTLQGWMNQIHDYDPEMCHPALTHSVFATLEGSSLRLDYPRNNITRRAVHDERVSESTFIKSRCFQLSNSKVFLLPPVLARKRTWNPKYPICIQLTSSRGPQEDESWGWPDHIFEHAVAQKHPADDPPEFLYLFGRTGREKEEWFHRLLLASTRQDGHKDAAETGRACFGESMHGSGVLRSRNVSRVGSSDEEALSTPSAPGVSLCGHSRGAPLLDYPTYMARLLAVEETAPLSSPGASSAEASPTIKCTCDGVQCPEKSQTSWANALIGRIFWDFLREKCWADVISRKIQKKLSKIRLPYFMNELALTELDMGCGVPRVTAASMPEMNHRGLWVELQMVYTGNLQMTLQTKFNLSKLGKESVPDTAQCSTETGSSRPVLSVLADSEEESSSAASSDEDELLFSEPMGEKSCTAPPDGTGAGKTGRKILRFVDKIAKSKYFQRAVESEFIKKKFEEMSNTPLLLTVEVRELSGTLVVNVPPPPTDRIWYSFCVPPKLDLHVCPKLGGCEVNFCHVTEWIEKKLQDEFQKVFVLPNMDDIFLPIMHSGLDNLQPCTPQKSQSVSTESIEKIQPESEEGF